MKKGLAAVVLVGCVVFRGALAQESSRRITIPEGIALVLKDSRLIKISLADKDMAVEDSLMARSALLPQVNLSAGQHFLNRAPLSKAGEQRIATGEKSSFSYGFDVYQTLFDFGKALAQYHASAEMVRARRENIEAIKRLAVLEYLTAYFNLLESEKMIGVAQNEVETLTAYQKDIEHLYEQGAATKNDVLPAKVKLADVRQRLIAARNARAMAGMRLNSILALPLTESIQGEDIVMSYPQFPGREEAWKTAQAQRPEIRLTSDLLQASMYSEKAQAAQRFPSLFADAGYSYAENKYQVHQDNLFLNLGAKMNIFDAGARSAAVLKERDRQRQLFLQQDSLIEDIRMEIEDSHLGLTDAQEKMLVTKDAVGQAEENVRVTRIRYAEGAATSTEVLEAIALQTLAATNHYRADYEVKRNYAKLMYSMGIDLSLIYGTMDNAAGKK